MYWRWVLPTNSNKSFTNSKKAGLSGLFFALLKYLCSALHFTLIRFSVVLKWLSILFPLSFFLACKGYKPVANQNLSHLYNRNFPLRVQFRVLESGPDLQVFIQVNFRKLDGMQNHLAVWEKYHLVYRVTSGYESNYKQLGDTIHPSERLAPSINPLVLVVKIPKSEKDRLFELHIKERFSQEDYVFDLPIHQNSESGNYKTCLFAGRGRIPVFENFIQVGDTVVVRSLNYQSTDSSFEFHPFNTSIALPPMAAIPTSGHDFTESFQVNVPLNEPAVFKQAGYYFMEVKGMKNQGFGFMVTPRFYPIVSTPAELIDPMVYISTREERKNLIEATNQKLALDQFWLKINVQKDQSRKLIRSYFENVEEANFLFASHKAGWKTDRGMVYAIYGQPPLVYKNWDSEMWQYDKSVVGENTVFYFTRHPVEKNPNIWELKRYNEYDRVWYGVVELWRKGVINR